MTHTDRVRIGQPTRLVAGRLHACHQGLLLAIGPCRHRDGV